MLNTHNTLPLKCRYTSLERDVHIYIYNMYILPPLLFSLTHTHTHIYITHTAHRDTTYILNRITTFIHSHIHTYAYLCIYTHIYVYKSVQIHARNTAFFRV